MKLTNAFGIGWVASPSDLATAIAALDPDSNNFTVLGGSDQVYIQTAYEDGSLVVEKREGSPGHHFRAWHVGGSDRLDKSEVLRVFDAYYRKASMPPTIEWRPYRLDGSGLSLSRALSGFSPIKALTLIGLVVALYFFTNQIRGFLQ